MADASLKKILGSITGYLEIERRMGVDCFLREKALQRRLDLLKEIEEEVLRCEKCSLYKTRKKPVLGEGNLYAKILFLGEAPGVEEDREGKPFVGRAGKLLTQIVEALGFRREEVYITNVLKCRPPENRSPLPQEVNACFDYLQRQIEIIKPSVICALGRFANLALSKNDLSLNQIHGKEYFYAGIKVIPTFHPAYLLRNPEEKKTAWQDFKKVIKILNPKSKTNKLLHLDF
ncbi:MAG: uracil-DNA glycosylase [Candidatus Omnitrophica bacterium]|nr:uracil-DNA glycosylase [Candidatus Omnitrophota bacterium]MCM8798737.1 uracil-DNA glycosylase [Candidatus Omnitrophota bacterium]